jgi:hypothetical protein
MKKAAFLLTLTLLLLATPVSVFAQRSSATPSAKMRSCIARESVVKNRLEKLWTLSSNIESIFDRHATKVKNYYAEKVLPSGKTVSNYSILVSDIDNKKAAVDAALNKAKTQVMSFSCDDDNPRLVVNQFRLDMLATKKALQDYKTSIKNLIVAVRSVNK